MTPHGWLTLVTCAGELGFVLLAATRSGRSGLGFPLALLGMVLFTSNLASLGFDLSGNAIWNVLDVTTSPFTTPVALHFVVSFVGRKRQLRWVLVAAYAFFGAFSMLTALAFRVSWAAWCSGATWSTIHLAAAIPAIAFGVALFVGHLRRSTSLDERRRTRLLLLAFGILVALGITDLLENMGAPVPRLGNLGALTCTALWTVVAFRLRLFGRELGSSVLVLSVALGATGLLVYVAAFRSLSTQPAALVLATATLTVTLAVAAFPNWAGRRTERERSQRLQLMGRFTAQMTHDLKNPLAAMKGATQFLAEEKAAGRSLDAHADFIALLGQQVGRLESVIEKFHRLTALEVAPQELDLNALVERVLSLQTFAAGSTVKVSTALGANLPRLRADPDLLAQAVENLVRNAYEAMPQGGAVCVKTAREEGALILSVEDTGPGMDSRTAERVFDEFFTTKPTGSGLGLAFVQRVAAAHGGEAVIDSREGVGTAVRVRLPAAAGSRGAR